MTEAIFSNLAAIISAMGTIAAAWFAYNQYTKNKLSTVKITLNKLSCRIVFFLYFFSIYLSSANKHY